MGSAGSLRIHQNHFEKASLRETALMHPPRLVLASASLLVLLVAACQAGSPRSVDRAAVRDAVERVMARHYTAFQRGDLSAWSAPMAEQVLLIAADPAEALSGRAAVLAQMQKDFEPAFAAGLKLSLEPGAHTIWVDEDGMTAATIYDLAYTATIENRSYPLHLRSSSILVRDSSGWIIQAEHYSRPIQHDSLFLDLMSNKVPRPVPIQGDIAPGAGPIVAQFRSDIADISQATPVAEVTVITPGGISHGVVDTRGTLIEWLGPPGSAREEGSGLRARLTSPTVGWVATNLKVPVFAGPESAIATMRVLFVYHLEGTRWKLLQGHLSVGVGGPA
jgi:ketosteroid isomerase-like protein